MTAPLSSSEREQRVAALRAIAPFDRLADLELALLVEVAAHRRYAPGAVVHHGEGGAPKLIMTIAGATRAASGSNHPVAGLPSMFDPYAVERLVADDTVGAETLSLDRQTFFTVARECPALIRGFLEGEGI
ncbi:MAG TPA: hypothetical protein VGG27_09575 [Magnetospirillaceae bacterium]|jgi:predicted short-subunit dehydrogenase-like oxidoreductase (DUF2520 family)